MMHLYRSIWLPLLTLTLAIALTAVPRASADEDIPDYIADEIVIKLVNPADLAAIAAEYNLILPILDQFGSRPIYRLRIADGTDAEDKANQLKPKNRLGDPRVIYAEPNYIAQTPEGRRGRSRWAIGGDAGAYAAQWAPQRLRLAEAHTLTRGAGTIVAVLDTGVDSTHPALAGRLLPGFDFVDFDNDPREEGVYGTDIGYGHGTHVAGMIALTAPEARILPIRVLDRDGAGNFWVLAEGLRFAIDPDGDPATDDGADVINLSLGTLRRTDLIEEIISEITCANDDDDDDDELCNATGGTVVIAAAGNGGDTIPQYPAAEESDGSLAVAASTQTDTLATFSTRGPWVRISAPGEEIISTVPGSTYGTWSGTSMAAPSVAGVAALVRAQDPSLGAVAVVERLVITAQPLCSIGPPRLDAAASLGLAPAESSCGRAFLPLIHSP